MKLGLAADHGGYELKEYLKTEIESLGHDAVDFGAYRIDPEDDYPDYVVPLALAVSGGDVERGVVICGSGVGACIAANKVRGVRAALITDIFSAHQGVEDDDMNVLCLGGRVVGHALALDLVRSFVSACFKKNERFIRRLNKVRRLEEKEAE